MDWSHAFPGEYKDGKKHGLGKHVYSSGDIFEGIYVMADVFIACGNREM